MIGAGASQVVLVVKNLLANAEQTRVQSLGQEDTMEEGMATHSNIFAWRIPRTKEPGGLQSMGIEKSWTQLKQFSIHDIGFYSSNLN